MYKYIIILISIFGISYSQCNDLIESECASDSDCEWIDNIEYGWCGSYDNNSAECNNQEQCSYSTCAQECNWGGSAECESYPGCSYSYLTYSCSGTTYVPCCSGGSFQEDNSYCQEMPSCTDMNQLQCVSSGECEWVEDTEIENCYGIAWNEQDCEEVEGCTWWTSNYYGTSNCTGSYEAYNSYCEDAGMLECSQMNESECSNDGSCEWAEDFEWGYCGNLSPSWNNGGQFCNDPSVSTDQCYTYTCYGGYYGDWNTCCGGDPYIIDNNSYCADVSFIPGDSNGDGSLNVTDIVLIVDLILSVTYDQYSDVNQDGLLNIIDVVDLVNTILDI